MSNQLNFHLESLPLVTYCIPVYNHEEYVANAIKSIIYQDYKNIELIIINDGSTDNSSIAIKELESKCQARFNRFIYIDRENRGLSSTLNEALIWSKGKYFAGLASDDLIKKDKVSKQVYFMERNNDCSAVFGSIELIDQCNHIYRKKTMPLAKYYFEDIICYNFILPAATQFIRKKALQNISFDEKLKIEDWYMYLRLTEERNYYIARLPDILASYRRHDTNTSKNLSIMKEKILILKRYKNLPIYKKAKANILLSISMDYAPFEFFNSIKYLFLAFKKDPYLLFTKKGTRATIKTFLPKFIMKKYQ
ncbi:glycosyltransferase family 2 protein [Photorhabdus heterorhabditis]|uniref:glycosyltransferase family 2 protein n=1 Tax=Photorhabdus heterorhabditis TaxID=880156 RepID=UPI0006C8A9D3|nr:glycosyltransferase family A protein [Photorhabdus heterorhabditis]